jgi:putative ABC transport system permease protein
MGEFAGLAARPTDLALSYILIYIINRRSLGWTLQMSLQPDIFAQALIGFAGAALIAGIYPAWRISRTSPRHVLSSE